MIAATAIPVEEYLRTSYDPDMEYVCGQLVERNVGEYYHGLLQNLLGIELGVRGPEQRFRVFTETRFRIPDISVKALPHVITPVLVRPDLVIEIVSPDDEPL